MSLACASWESFLEGDPRLASYTNVWKNRDPFRHRKGEWGLMYVDRNVTYFIDNDMPSTALRNVSSGVDAASPRRLHFVSAHRNSSSTYNRLSATTCSVTESHVEVAIVCSAAQKCRATKMRRSLIDTRPEFQVPLEHKRRMHFIAHSLPFIEISTANTSTSTEAFLWAAQDNNTLHGIGS
jgi:hypothetical protein